MTPFWMLVRHFVQRMFAGENEDTGGGISLGMGAAVAILASPGALASLFLIDKYSPLLQWFRGQIHFNPYRASINDEYVFVILSMTITGLVMVLRWNRLFPDRRDFATLASLPIPSRNIFLANLVALLGLGLLFGLDVNLVSSFIFPAVVTMKFGTFGTFLHVAIGHAASVLLASMFSFFGVFFLVGLLTLLLPKSLFRPVSVILRVSLVVALLAEWMPRHPEAYAPYLPPLWFLGIYERMIGLATPAVARLSQRALLCLFAEILLGMAAYALCYQRQFLKLAESLEALGAQTRRRHMTLPEWGERLLFRSRFEYACISFALKVLLRNERHLMFFGGYLGVGLVVVAQAALDTDYLSVPLLIAFFAVTGLRFVFDMPAALNANWVFRVSAPNPEPPPRAVARRLMFLVTLPWELFIFPITARSFGYTTAFLHTVTVMAVTIVLIETVLLRFRKIPFTCSTQPDTRQFVIRILGALLGILMLIPAITGVERWMFPHPVRFISLAIFLSVAWILLRRHQEDILTEEDVITFEERPPAAFELLHLGRV